MSTLLILCVSFVFTLAEQPVQDCSRSTMDLVFVVDSSGSLRSREFEMVKQFLVNVTQGLVVSPDNIRVGLVRFSSNVDVIAYLIQSRSSADTIATISSMRYKSGGTHTSAALRVTREGVLQKGGGDREGVADVVVVVTDGRSWFPEKTAQEALLLRNRQVEIIVLGIGNNLLMSELQAMTSGEVRVIDNFVTLREVVDDIRAVVCTVADQAREKLHPSSPSPSSSTTGAPSPPLSTPSPPTEYPTTSTEKAATSPPTSLATSPITTPPITSSPAMTSSSTASSSETFTTSSSATTASEISTTTPTSTQPPTQPPTRKPTSPAAATEAASLPTTEKSPTTPPITQSDKITTFPLTTTNPTTTTTTPTPSTMSNGRRTTISLSPSPPTASAATTTTTTAAPSPPPTQGKESFAVSFTHESLKSTKTPSAKLLDSPHAPISYDCQHQEMDVVFVQDASYSLGINNFETAKSFIANIVRQLPIGLDRVRVALVRFSSQVDVIARLSQSRDVSSVTQAVAGMGYQTGGTQTGLALETVRTQVLNESRPDARTVVVVITDGESQTFYDTRKEAKTLRRAKVRLVWLYINASDANHKSFDRERRYMAGQGDTTLAAASFEDLDEETRRGILHASCKEDPVPETTTTTTKSTTTTTTTMKSTTTTSTVTPTSHTTKTSPTYPSPAITDSDGDVTEPATSSTDDDESSSSPDTSSVENASSPLPKSSPTKASTHVRPSESETVAKTSKAASDFHTTHREPATSEPITSTSGIRRKPTNETDPRSTSSPEMTTQEQSPSTSGGEQTTEKKSDSTDSKEGSQSGMKGAGAFEDNVWNIVGVAVGSGLAVAVSSACIYGLWRRRKDKREKNKPTSDA